MVCPCRPTDFPRWCAARRSIPPALPSRTGWAPAPTARCPPGAPPWPGTCSRIAPTLTRRASRCWRRRARRMWQGSGAPGWPAASRCALPAADRSRVGVHPRRQPGHRSDCHLGACRRFRPLAAARGLRIITVETGRARKGRRPRGPPVPDIGLERRALMLYTSGTTSRPKEWCSPTATWRPRSNASPKRGRGCRRSRAPRAAAQSHARRDQRAGVRALERRGLRVRGRLRCPRRPGQRWRAARSASSWPCPRSTAV